MLYTVESCFLHDTEEFSIDFVYFKCLNASYTNITAQH